ncbi:hypothetical protein ACFQH2_09635 [Natronoarchaeum sp. GCM10025703]|uniref:hypothetical protein n=1 Tax=Natronoarchaeum sp. GCM10025703 TaxID=3252685 RepID=UPI00360D0D67
MIERVAKATLLALYQLTIVIGIVLMPVAVALQRTLGRAPRFTGLSSASIERTKRRSDGSTLAETQYLASNSRVPIAALEYRKLGHLYVAGL